MRFNANGYIFFSKFGYCGDPKSFNNLLPSEDEIAQSKQKKLGIFDYSSIKS